MSLRNHVVVSEYEKRRAHRFEQAVRPPIDSGQFEFPFFCVDAERIQPHRDVT